MTYQQVRHPHRLTSLFSSAFIENLIRGSHASYLRRVINETDFGQSLYSTQTVEEVLEKVFNYLSEYHRCEYIFKTAVLNERLLKRHDLNKAVYLTEFRSYNSKADIVILNGSSSVYEIKSDMDTFDRLDDQLNSYQKIFDKVFVVTNERSCKRLITAVPAEIGILRLNDDLSLRTIRDAHSNIGQFDKGVMFDSLRKDEYVPIIQEITGKAPLFPGTVMHSKCRTIFKALSNIEAHRYFVRALKKRKFNDAQVELLANTSLSIKSAIADKRHTASNCKQIIKGLKKEITSL